MPVSRSAPSGPRGTSLLARRLLPLLWPAAPRLRRAVVAATAALVAAKLVAVAVPFLLKAAVDALGGGPAVLPLAPLIAYGAARFLASGLQQLKDALFARVAERAGRDLARRVYAHLFALDLAFHLGEKPGGLARAVERGVRAVSFLLQTVLFGLLPTLLEFLLVLAVLLGRYPPLYAGIVFATVALYAAFTVLTTEWRTRHRREMNRREEAFAAAAVEGLVHYETVRAFAAEAREVARLDRLLAAYEDAAVRSRVSLALLNAGQALVVAAGVTAAMVVAAGDVVAGTATVGDVVLLNAFLLQLYVPLDFLGVIWRQLRQSVADLERVEALLARRPEVTAAPGAPAPVLREGGRVRFEHVAFAYDPRRPILVDVDFEIPPGRRVAVVGPSGAGKTTLVRLLFRFFDPDRGRITLDGQDLRAVDPHALRRLLGLVPQEAALFHDTLAANIAYARPDASRAEILRAARIARLDGLLARLPDGLETVVGERGLRLSGGERQRVAIARVVLADPPILVLDEATSALDSRTERELREALDRVTRGRTTLVIAHRLASVVDADLILVLDGGRIVERGTHRELVARGGLYAALWARQQAAGLAPAATPC